MRKSEEYILSKPEPFKSILIYLQLRIEQQFPKAQLKYKWHLPFYYIEDKPFCYLNYTKGYVDIAFMCGKHLTKHLDKLNGEKRVLVKSLRYKNLEEIDDEILKEVLDESYAITLKK